MPLQRLSAPSLSQDEYWKKIAKYLSHEVGNPVSRATTDLLTLAGDLASIEQLMRERGILTEGLVDLVERCKRASERAIRTLGLADAVIAAMKQFQREGDVQREYVNASDVVSEGLEAYAGDAFRIEIDVEAEPIYCCRSLLASAFAELTENAKKWFDKLDPRLKVVGRVVGDNFEFTIEDNGCGIPQADKRRIFEPDFVTSSGGSGIGLALVRGTVEIHHSGKIFEDGVPGEGARFTIRLPRGYPTAAEVE